MLRCPTLRPMVVGTVLILLATVDSLEVSRRLVAQDTELVMLAEGGVTRRAVRRGQEHRYGITLRAGEFTSVLVDGHDIDVVVETEGPDGDVRARFVNEAGKRTPVRADIVADRDAIFIVVVEPTSGASLTGSYSVVSRARRLATSADRSMQQVYAARVTAERFHLTGRHALAQQQLDAALLEAERVLGPDDVEIAGIAAQLAEVHLGAADVVLAESLFRRALAIRERSNGPDHPASAFLRARLAAVYQQAGHVLKAEATLIPALATIETALGHGHPWVVRCLRTLGNLRVAMGRLDEAETIHHRALAILDDIGENDTAMYTGLLNNLGVIARQQKDYVRAEAFFHRALAANERQGRAESSDAVKILSNLALVANSRRDYQLALGYYGRVLSMHERLGAAENAEFATILNNVAVIYQAIGDRARSLDTHFRALRIREATVGANHPGTLQSVANLALMHWLGSDVAGAVAFQRRAEAIVEAQLTLDLQLGSERQKLARLESTVARTDRTISLHLRAAPHEADAAMLAALVLLQRKGRVLDAMARTVTFFRDRVIGAEDRRLLDGLIATTTQLSRLVLNASDQQRATEYKRQVDNLEIEKDRLEAELGARNAQFRAETQAVTIEAVQAAIPADAALIEYGMFHPIDPRGEAGDATRPAHYVAYVIRRTGAPQGVDLGPATAIDAIVDTMLAALRDPRRDVGASARALEARIFRPLRPYLARSTRILISPDGRLNLIPFESLQDEKGQYLLERFAATYLTSGRDLLRLGIKRGHSNPPLVIADPLFGEPGVNAGSKRVPAASAADTPTATGGRSPIYFGPLYASAEEARIVKAAFPDAVVLTGAHATKEAIVRAERPRVLHIASHGFFLQHGWPEPAAAQAVRGNRDNAMLQSGLALAGANDERLRPDAILTALEVSALDLWGTKLVTLSACDTGVGDIRVGEGVYGLRRAFALAGAETVVMSLWPVGDTISRQTMKTYYAELRAGTGRADALRRAKLAMRARPGRQHPFYWAGFISSGEWANLAGVR